VEVVRALQGLLAAALRLLRLLRPLLQVEALLARRSHQRTLQGHQLPALYASSSSLLRHHPLPFFSAKLVLLRELLIASGPFWLLLAQLFAGVVVFVRRPSM
jgi:hypothetical protein